MELKTKYQYSYFLHPFMVKENRYTKYILKLLKNQNCKLKIFQKEKDIGIYKYFVPKIRNYMFSTFTFNNTKIRKFEELSLDTRAAILAKMPCVIFEYNFQRDIQGKTEVSEGIFFAIQKVEIICFNTGICFLNIKTNECQNSSNKIDEYIRIYNEIEIEISNFIKTDCGKECIRIFDETFPNCKDFSDYKKIDFYLWNLGK